MQMDRYRQRMWRIAFDPHANLAHPVHERQMALTMVTCGKRKGRLNGRPVEIAAPCMLALTQADTLTLEPGEDWAAQTFVFPEDFFGDHSDLPTGIDVFRRTEGNTGWFPLEAEWFAQLRDWFFIIGTETLAQSDARWVCRIKQYLIRILNILADSCGTGRQAPLDRALALIHAQYFQPLTLDALCRKAGLNRVSLNRQCKQAYGCTAMQYLSAYRLRMAEKLLTYTKMSLADIAHAVGYEYDTYFIRVFTAQKGVSPTQYRLRAQRTAQ